MTSQKDNRFYREAEGGSREARIEDDGSHIYWFDPVEGCWVAFRRVDCVVEEELPEQRISGFRRGAPAEDSGPTCQTCGFYACSCTGAPAEPARQDFMPGVIEALDNLTIRKGE